MRCETEEGFDQACIAIVIQHNFVPLSFSMHKYEPGLSGPGSNPNAMLIHNDPSDRLCVHVIVILLVFLYLDRLRLLPQDLAVHRT